jgi:hypothetical protein
MVAANRLTKWTLEKQAAYNAQTLSESEPVRENRAREWLLFVVGLIAGLLLGRV